MAIECKIGACGIPAQGRCQECNRPVCASHHAQLGVVTGVVPYLCTECVDAKQRASADRQQGLWDAERMLSSRARGIIADLRARGVSPTPVPQPPRAERSKGFLGFGQRYIDVPRPPLLLYPVGKVSVWGGGGGRGDMPRGVITIDAYFDENGQFVNKAGGRIEPYGKSIELYDELLGRLAAL